MHSLYFSKTDMSLKPATHLMGSNPHLIKRYKYIDQIISLPPADEQQNDRRKLEFVTNFLHH